MSTTPTPPPAPPAPTAAQAIATVKSDITLDIAAARAEIQNLATESKNAIMKLIADSEAAVGVTLPTLKALFTAPATPTTNTTTPTK